MRLPVLGRAAADQSHVEASADGTPSNITNPLPHDKSTQPTRALPKQMRCWQLDFRGRLTQTLADRPGRTEAMGPRRAKGAANHHDVLGTFRRLLSSVAFVLDKLNKHAFRQILGALVSKSCDEALPHADMACYRRPIMNK